MEPLALSQLWESVGAEVCKTFDERRKTRKEYLINSHVDYKQVAANINVIMKRLLQVLEVSFPNVFLTTPIEIKRTPVGTRQTTLSSIRNRPSRRTRRGASSSSEEGGKWSCMGYTRTVHEWVHEPVEKANANMHLLVEQLRKCLQESEEKFLVMPLTWRLVTKWGEGSSHYSCIVVDLSPRRGVSEEVRVVILDVNGYGNSPTAYKNVFKEPSMGLNPLIQAMITSLFDFASKALHFQSLQVSFPSFSGINVRARSAMLSSQRDLALFPDVPLQNLHMESGVCSIATVFMIIRLACDQRKVFKDGIDVTLKKFTKSAEGGMAEYRHVLFVRAFTYSLLAFLEMDTASFGIKGDPYLVVEQGKEWNIYSKF